MAGTVTIAIPTLDAGRSFEATLEAIARQEVDAEVELLVCDSGSGDGTVAIARRHGARVLEIPRERFSHGETRNELAAHARGDFIAFLTQDAVPVGVHWLASLLAGFRQAADVGLVYGPYRPRADASLWVRRELTTWFRSLSADGAPRVDVLDERRRAAPAREFLGPLGYFTDANGCIARRAWEQVPFRAIGYAEDHMLAQDMLRAGFAKVYMPSAAVVHSHEYTLIDWLRRSFDEARALSEIYGVVPPGRWRDAARNLRGNVAADLRLALRESQPIVPTLWGSLVHHGARTAGVLLGARSERLPRALVERLSLERRR